MPEERHAVVVTHAPPGLDLRRDFAALPPDYGTPAYFARPDVQAIRRMLQENLEALDGRTHFLRRLQGRLVILKPNLVTVYSGMGLAQRDYPETTDPRLLDAVVEFLQPHAGDMVIAESSGRGVPTRGSFRVAGLNRLAAYRGVRLAALEEMPVLRYILPRARVQKEILVPELFAGVISGEAFYISIPKMKTNLYTGVTLGFKNAMGILPYNLRQRNHHYAIDQKLVDMLHLFQPHLTIIDGLVGGEGNCPAPVDPVDSRVVISGTHSVETDRVATRMMGFDPSAIPLMALADADGFGMPNVEVVGEQTVIPFRPAEPSMHGAAFRAAFPNVAFFTGHRFEGGAELGCRGGCLATTRFAFDMFLREGQPRDFRLVLVIGAGLLQDGQPVYLDHAGKPHSLEQILALPGKKMAVGRCAGALHGRVDCFVDGCMPYPNAPHAALHRLTGTWCRVMSPANRHLLPLLWDTLCMCEARKRLVRAGHRLDVPLPDGPGVVQPRPLSAEEQDLPFVRWDLPPLTPAEIRQACAAENRAVLATFFG